MTMKVRSATNCFDIYDVLGCNVGQAVLIISKV